MMHFAQSFAVGAAIPGTELNPAERQLLFGNFGTVTPENSWPSKRTNHPLLWDRALQPKPALSAVLALAREKIGQDAQPKANGDRLKPAP